MINDYKIVKHNNKEILYIYLDLNTEFSKNNSKQYKDIKELITKFINEHNIIFKGSIITIIVNGLFIGNIFLNKDLAKEYNSDILFTPQTTTFLKDDFKIDDLKETKTKEIIKNTSKKVENNIKKTTKPKVFSSNTSSSKAKTSKTNQQATKEYIKIKRKSGTIELELETYLIGVVAAEMPAEFHEQALMSQAIIARTYALKAISQNKVLTDDESTQSYKDPTELQKMWGSKYDAYYNKIKKAVDNTKGIYLSYKGSYIEAVYHSTSNGQTEDAKNVWGNSFPYLISVKSPYDTTNKSFTYTKKFSYSSISKLLNDNITPETEIIILAKTEGNRVKTISINNKTYTGLKIRSSLGLRSTDFVIEQLPEEVIITTKGYGHGVGLSQYGANGMAQNGSSYQEILKHYYKGVTISQK